MIASDLAIYAPILLPDNDVSVVGGEMDFGKRISFVTPLATSNTVEVVSTSTEDTDKLIVLVGREPSTYLEKSEVIALNGTTAVIATLLGTVDRVLEARLSAACVGDVTVRISPAGAAIGTILAGDLGFVNPFSGVFSGTGSKTYYVPVWVSHKHETETLHYPELQMLVNLPGDAVTFVFGLDKDTPITLTNRLTAPDPGEIDGSFSTATKFATAALAPGEGMPAVLKWVVGAAASPALDDFDLRTRGWTEI